MITRPRRFSFTSFDRSLWVPMTMSISPVRASHDVRGFLAALKRDSSAMLHRPVGEAVREGLEMLLGEQRGRAEDHHLLLVGDGDERGAQRDLGLAEADVAAHQAVHRLAGGHVGDHRFDRGGLVGRLLEAEAVGESLQVCCLMEKECPRRAARLAYSASSSAAVSRTCFAARALALSHWPLPSLCSGASSGCAPL
jgi:hypothetical protein